MIKTIELTSKIVEIDVSGGRHVLVKNRGNGTILVSKLQDITQNKDEVKTIEPHTCDILRNVAKFYDNYSNGGKSNYYGRFFACAIDGNAIMQVEVITNENLRVYQWGTIREKNVCAISNDDIICEDDGVFITSYVGTYLEE